MKTNSKSPARIGRPKKFNFTGTKNFEPITTVGPSDVIISQLAAAQIMGVSLFTVREYSANGEFARAVVIAGRTVGFRLADVEAFKDKFARTAAA